MAHDYIPANLREVQTLPELFAWRVAASPSLEAYRHFDAASSQWLSLSWQEIGAQMSRWRRALLAHRLAPGARVAILVPNGLDHVCMDLATLSLGLVPVPMHAVDNPDSIGYILQDSEASLLLVDSAERWQAIAAAGGVTPALRRVIALDADATDPGNDLVVGLNAWLQAASPANGETDDDHELPRVSPDAMAALVYTSGTTGRPKGVMLSHRNVVSNIQAVLERFVVTERDVLLSFLPLSHTFERTLGYYLPIAAGACVAYARSVALLQEDLLSVRPTVLVSVPRIYERIYAKVQETIHERGAVGRTLLAWTEKTGWRKFLATQRHADTGKAEQLLWAILRPLVADKVLAAFGGRLRLAIAGGAPLSANVAHFFLGMGLNLLQGYGMTESSPVVSGNTPDDNEPASVGRPLSGVQVRIGENDELLIAGPNVMLGYWHRPEDTQRMLEPDGWLHTGDQAKVVDGRLHIVGRIKDIIVTSTGEKIPPADLELAIQADPLFAQVLVVGEQRPFLAVLAVVDQPTWEREAKALGLEPASADSLQSDAARGMALARIAAQAKSFPSYATPKQVFLTREPWTIDAGLMTPTLKLKRPALEKRFATEIARMYEHR
ncbi:MAG: AMP-dependent synthetase/ligase [Porticoccaceae bacterium]